MDWNGLLSSEWTTGGLLAAVVLLLLFGGLVPWRQHNLVVEREKTKDATIASQQETIRLLTTQNAKYQELGNTAVKLLESIPGTGGEH